MKLQNPGLFALANGIYIDANEPQVGLRGREGKPSEGHSSDTPDSWVFQLGKKRPSEMRTGVQQGPLWGPQIPTAGQGKGTDSGCGSAGTCPKNWDEFGKSSLCFAQWHPGREEEHQ